MPPPGSRASSTHNLHGRRENNSHLRPEDAYYNTSPPRRSASPLGRSDTVTAADHPARRGRRNRSSSRRRAAARKHQKQQWRKLLWVKQSFPDNYTDEETFLDHLQRNPRLRPYEFWPLVADSTIIVQHVCSVVVFVCCFTGIFQQRVSPQVVVGLATLATVAGWVFRDHWQSSRGMVSNAETAPASPVEEEDEDTAAPTSPESSPDAAMAPAEFGQPFHESRTTSHSRNPSGASNVLSGSYPPPLSNLSTTADHFHTFLQTTKSALLIVSSLLGLSPILKSLTQSTSSDSIWALTSWLLILNVFTFDYGTAPPTSSTKHPASLSTNAALMASTVLASRLPSTTHVFSLTLFSIEVFGLFPVFRRHLRHCSWAGHLWLTTLLVILASGGLSMTISGGGWAMGVVGVVLGGVITALSMGLTSWWLIGLQRYKNEIRGPWDPARPVIRRGGWD